MCFSCNLTIILLLSDTDLSQICRQPDSHKSTQSQTDLVAQNIDEVFVWIKFGCALKEWRYDSTGVFDWHNLCAVTGLSHSAN